MSGSVTRRDGGRVVRAALGAVGIVLGLVAIAAFGRAGGGPRGGVGASGDLYVPMGGSADAVAQFDGVTGAYVGDFVTTGSGGLNEAVGLAFDAAGDLYVTSYTTDEVLRYDGLTGAFVEVFVSAGSGGLNGPYGLTFGQDGHLYVCSFLTNKVLKYDGSTGASLGAFVSSVTYPVDLAFGPGGDLFVSRYSGNDVLRYNGTTGSLIGTFASGGGLSGACGLAFGPGGDLYVAGYNNDAVLRYDGVSGAFVEVFASGGGLDGAFGVAFGPDSGSLLASGYASNSVIEYDGDTGALLGTFASGVTKAALIEFKPYLGPFPEPVLTDFQPATAGNCGVLVGATISGTGLVQGAQLTLTQSGQPDIPGWVTGVTPETQITASFDLTGVATGFWDLVLTYPDDQTDTLVDALEVTTCPAPTVTGIDPNSAGNCGVLLGATITGTDFLAGATVTLSMLGEGDIFGTNVNVQSSTTITADFDLASAAIGLWDVTVENPSGLGSDTLIEALDVTACPPPNPTDFQPATEDNCGTLTGATITGSDFLPGATVKLSMAGESDVAGTNVVVQSSTTITADFDLSGAAVGFWELTVTNPAPSGPGSQVDALEVTACPPPTVTGFDPSPAENCEVLIGASISGTNFSLGSTVKLTMAGQSDISGANVNVQSSTTITADFDISGAATGLWDVVVTRPDAESATLTAALQVLTCSVPQLGDPGDLYVSTQDNGVLQYHGPTGALVGRFVSGAAFPGPEPSGLTFGPNGNLFVAEYSAWVGSVIEFDGQTGAYVRDFVAEDGSGLRRAGDLVFGPNGNLLVCSEGTDNVLEFDGDTGAPLGAFASGGGLDGPTGLTFGPNGNLFVASYASDKVIEYDGATGGSVGTFASVSYPLDLAFGPNGNLFVCSYDPYNGNGVYEFDGATGAPLGVFVDVGSSRLAFGPDDSLFLRGSHKINRYLGDSGAFLRQYASMQNPEYFTFKPLPGPFPQPAMANLTPSQATTCMPLFDAAVSGSGLVWGATVRLTRVGEEDIIAAIVGTTANEQELSVAFDLTAAAPGLWDLVLTYPDAQTNTLIHALEVLDCGPPAVTAFDPASADNCGLLSGATITGENFTPDTTVKLAMAGRPDIIGTNVDVQSWTTIVADFDLTPAFSGLWDLVVTRPGEPSATLADALEVTACPSVQVSDFTPATTTTCGVLRSATITGLGFAPGTTVKLSRPGETDIVGANVNVQSATTIFADFDVTDAAVGLWDLVATRPDAQSGTLAGALELTEQFQLFGAPGDLYVVQYAYNDGEILQYDGVNGALVGTFATTSPFSSYGVCDLTFRTNGNLLVTDGITQSVGEFDGATGAFIGYFVPQGVCGIDDPLGLVWGPNGDLFVGSRGDGAEYGILEFGADGSCVGWLAGPFDTSDMRYPRRLAFDANGDLLAADRYGWKVPRIDGDTGALLGALGGVYETACPQTVDVAPNANVWMATGDAIAELDAASGDWLGTLASGGGLLSICDVAVAPNGDLFVADGGYRLDRWGEIGPFGRIFRIDSRTGEAELFIEGAPSLPQALAVKPFINLSPQISGVSTAVADNCGPIDITIAGGDLYFNGIAVRLVRSGEAEITGLVTGGCRPSQVDALFDLTGAAPGDWDLLVSYPDSEASLPAALTITDGGGCDPPVVTGLSPVAIDNCSALAGAVITGSGFTPSTTVKLNDGVTDIDGVITATPTNTMIVADFDLTGANTGAWDLHVTNPDSQSAALPAALTLTAACRPPAVTGVSPGGADNCIPQIVSYAVTGDGFVDGATVRLTLAGENDIVGTDVEVLFSTRLVADFELTGAAPGSWDVVVTNPDDQSGTLAGGFDVTCRADCPAGENCDWIHGERFAGTLKTSGGIAPRFKLEGFDPDGNPYLISTATRFLVGGGTGNFVHQLKLDRNTGEVLWETPNLYGTFSHRGCVDGDGNLLIVKACNNPPAGGVCVRKYDTDGAILWERQLDLPWLCAQWFQDWLVPQGELYSRWLFDDGIVRRLRIRVSDGELLDWYSEDPGVSSAYYECAGADGCYYMEEICGGEFTIRKYCGSALVWDRPDLDWGVDFVGGVLYDFVDGDVQVEGKYRIRVRRLDDNGDEVWSHDYAPPDPNDEVRMFDSPHDDPRARLDRQGNIVLLGYRPVELGGDHQLSLLRIRPADGALLSFAYLQPSTSLRPVEAPSHGAGNVSLIGVDPLGNAWILREQDKGGSSYDEATEAVLHYYSVDDGEFLGERVWVHPWQTVHLEGNAGEGVGGWLGAMNARGDCFVYTCFSRGVSTSLVQASSDPRVGNNLDLMVAGIVSGFTPGDPDGDGAFDLDDFAVFADCMGGPTIVPDPPPPTEPADCLLYFDLDHDGDVDLADYALLTGGSPPAMGACCLDAGGCEITTQPSCVGYFMGVGTTCDDVYCEGLGACCLEDGSCEVTLPWLCRGEFQGEGTTCETVDCAVGACCLADGSCVEIAGWACTGLYQGEGTTCATVDCPTGACCLADGTCLDVAGWACGGDYQGDGTECSLDSCPGGRYSNEIDTVTSYIAAGAGLQLADDMTLDGAGWRDLVYVDLLVYGGGGGMFNVTVELWTDCPGNGGTLIPNTTFTATGVPDDGYAYVLSADLSGAPATIPDTVWMVVTFSTSQAGWIIAEDAETGFTADIFGRNDPPWVCNYYQGGDPYSGFWANLECVEGGGKARGDGGETRLTITPVEAPALLRVIEATE